MYEMCVKEMSIYSYSKIFFFIIIFIFIHFTMVQYTYLLYSLFMHLTILFIPYVTIVIIFIFSRSNLLFLSSFSFNKKNYGKITLSGKIPFPFRINLSNILLLLAVAADFDAVLGQKAHSFILH